ncbi:MAG: SLBB domain-containing protein, partial [Candidatus Omnitrophota bacterium]
MDLADLISDKDSANIRLKEWDIITVYSKKEVVPAYFVEIDGAVERPGKYEMTENMRLSDLIFRAGGLKTEALMGRAELFRPYGDSGQSVTEIDLKLALGKDANNAEKNNLLLKEGDHLFIRKNPDKKDKFIITLNGEFVYPGKYAVEKGTRLSDVIERA